MSSHSPNWTDEDDDLDEGPDFDPETGELVDQIRCSDCGHEFTVVSGQDPDHCPWCGADFA